MAEQILNERGYFWWNEDPIPKGHFAPESSVGGTLIVDENGSSRLELDGYLSRNQGDPIEAMLGHGQDIPFDKRIQGKLKDSGKSVLLLGLRANGSRLSSNGISYEHFAAEDCLVSYGAFPSTSAPLKFSMLSVSLVGLEEWLWLRNIEVTRTRTRIVAKYRLPTPDVYNLDDGSLTIRYHINGLGSGKSSRRIGQINMVESATLQFKPKETQSLKEMRAEYSLMQDLFILLTNSNYSLEWPELKFGKNFCYHYYQLPQRVTKEPKWNEFWVNFDQLRPIFGAIVETWRRKREEFGPGFYLYLGVRRGMKMYVEHSFVNLVWGLESLHRRKGTGITSGDKIGAKVQRILEQLSEGKDKQWLENRLKNAAEPSLQERLVEVLSMVPISIDKKSLQAFCKTCADRRNDISHFGGLRHEGDYGGFLTELIKKSEALKYLYHIVLLCEIGVQPDLLRRRFFDGPNSFAMKSALHEAGLVVTAPAAEASTE